MNTYQQKDIQILADAGKIKSAYAVNDQIVGGWTLIFVGSKKEDTYTLYTQRGSAVRVFKSVDAIVNVVKEIGLGELTVRTF